MTDDADASITELQCWLDNVESAQRMWSTVPHYNVDLGAWRMGAARNAGAPDCGSVACFGGWCAWWPDFIAQGVFASQGGAPGMTDPLDGEHLNGSCVADELFGDYSLFEPRSHEEDEDEDIAPGGYERLDDHEIVRRRLEWRQGTLIRQLDSR